MKNTQRQDAKTQGRKENQKNLATLRPGAFALNSPPSLHPGGFAFYESEVEQYE